MPRGTTSSADERVPELLEHIVFRSSLALGAALQPGPLQVFLVSRTMSIGWKRTLPACLAPVVSDGPIAVLALVVLGRVSPAARQVLQASGGALLLYLAAGAYREWREPARPPAPTAAPRTLLSAVLVNLLNPNPYLAWALVLGPTVVAAWKHQPAGAVAFVSAFYATMIATLAGFVCLAGTARQLDARTRRALVGGSALLLAALGVLLLLLSLR
jgi:threonine/homoserine/homoserine lactone efflux protein